MSHTRLYTVLGVILALIGGGIYLINTNLRFYANNPETEISRTFDRDFRNLTLEAQGEVFITQGDQDLVTILGNQRSLDTLEITETSQSLTIAPRQNDKTRIALSGNNVVQIFVTIRTLENLEVTGDLKVSLSNITVEELSIANNTSRFVSGTDIVTSELTINSIGAGFVELSGEADRVSVESDRDNRITLDDLVAPEYNLNLTSNPIVNLGNAESIQGSVSNEASVYYTGEPNLSNSLADSPALNQE
jgi:hypothetical protein